MRLFPVDKGLKLKREPLYTGTAIKRKYLNFGKIFLSLKLNNKINGLHKTETPLKRIVCTVPSKQKLVAYSVVMSNIWEIN